MKYLCYIVTFGVAVLLSSLSVNAKTVHKVRVNNQSANLYKKLEISKPTNKAPIQIDCKRITITTENDVVEVNEGTGNIVLTGKILDQG